MPEEGRISPRTLTQISAEAALHPPHADEQSSPEKQKPKHAFVFLSVGLGYCQVPHHQGSWQAGKPVGVAVQTQSHVLVELLLVKGRSAWVPVRPLTDWMDETPRPRDGN